MYIVAGKAYYDQDAYHPVPLPVGPFTTPEDAQAWAFSIKIYKAELKLHKVSFDYPIMYSLIEELEEYGRYLNKQARRAHVNTPEGRRKASAAAKKAMETRKRQREGH